MTKDEAVKKLEAAYFEVMTLIPRLTPTFAKNMQAAQENIREVSDALRENKIGGDE